MVADLRQILEPEYSVRARQLATQLTTPADSIARAADLFEHAARRDAR
jgi:UDP:flavonoid glycosyltransferase YjiC (YdhE family)